MRLSRDEWLHMAQALPEGGTARVPHKGDRTNRPNLVLHNRADCWTAYCQSCKVGARVDKTHVRYSLPEPPSSRDLRLPTDLVEVRPDSMPYHIMLPLLGFLARKGMDLRMFPSTPYFSQERQRLLFNTSQGWLGRDTTERSPQKWVVYNGNPYANPGDNYDPHGVPVQPRCIVVTEDLFSAVKVRWALQGQLDTQALSSLGTELRPPLVHRLVQWSQAWGLHSHLVLVFFDGDAAGYTGARKSARRLRQLGIPATFINAPQGMDPKDMTAEGIRQAIAGAISGHQVSEGAGESPAVQVDQGLHPTGDGDA